MVVGGVLWGAYAIDDGPSKSYYFTPRCGYADVSRAVVLLWECPAPEGAGSIGVVEERSRCGQYIRSPQGFFPPPLTCYNLRSFDG